MWGFPVAAFLQFAFAGALLYFIRKHGESLRETYYSSGKRMGRAYPVARVYDLLGLVATSGIFVLAGRHHGWTAALALVILSFVISLPMQLLLGWIAPRWTVLSASGLVLVPLCLANTAILVAE